jgi:hypothetical protein
MSIFSTHKIIKLIKNQKLLLILLFVFFSSCAIKGNFKGLYSYFNETQKEMPNLFIKLDSSDTLLFNTSIEKNKIYIINGIHLKKCLTKKNKSIVYFWDLNCKSKICYPLELIQAHCKKNNLSLFVVAEYYDAKIMSNEFEIDNNILAVNTKYYKSSLVNKYLTRFLIDIDSKLKYKNLNRYLYFEGDEFINDYRSIYDIN